MAAKMTNGVIKRGNGWSYVIRVKDPETGVMKPKWVSGYATEEEAKVARAEAITKIANGRYVGRSKLTLGEYLADWIDSRVDVRPGTASGYREDIEQYVIPNIGSLPIQSLDRKQLQRFYGQLAKSGGKDGKPLSRGTVAHVHRTLRKALADAALDKVIADNPAKAAKLPHFEGAVREVIRVFSPEQLARFLAMASAHRLYAFYRLAAYTGARRGELLYLRWGAVDLDKGEVTFSGSTDVIDGKRIDGPTKSGRTRVVSIDAGTVAVMRDHRKRQLEERLHAGSLWQESDLVFTREDGSPIYPDTVTALMRGLIESHNEPCVPGRRGRPREQLPRPANPLPEIRLHDLRHTHATTLLLKGVPVHVVAERLGHLNATVTLSVYAHVLRQDASGVAELFANAIPAS